MFRVLPYQEVVNVATIPLDMGGQRVVNHSSQMSIYTLANDGENLTPIKAPPVRIKYRSSEKDAIFFLCGV